MSTATISALRSSSVIRHSMSDSKGLMRFSQFRLRPLVCVSWCYGDAPTAIQDLAFGFGDGEPEFVTVVPNKMRFSHVPAGVKMIVELADGYICYE